MADDSLLQLGPPSDVTASQQHAWIRLRSTHATGHLAERRTRPPFVVDIRHLAWQEQAACSGTDPEGFFPDGNADGIILRLCRRCPVQRDCLQFALADPGLSGIWGGTTEAERRRQRDAAQRVAG